MPVIHLVDDDIAVTQACQFLLESLGYDVCVWNDSRTFIAQAPLHTYGIVLLDMRMPYMDGCRVHQILLEQHSTLAVIFLTGHGDLPMAVEQMKLGAVDFLQKPVATQPLQAALTLAEAATAKAVTCAQIRERFQTLTPKERQIAGFVARGLMNREIADIAHVAVRTVEVHRAKVMEKMAAGSLAELVTQLNSITAPENSTAEY
ncbi:tetrathionate respiration response regulator TtrR [Morganella morganii]|uniref:tetrathionate respiration response regulator TtrR n=1 Tax=Morganella morganii TaxID=582 RepID=UPI001C494B41|nr:tetrathionate respiration response regulator TtrR [Morganella morganii]QXO74220.1 response regulator transcription factor [Morganella morganii]